MASLHDSIAFLQKSNNGGLSLYDHLSDVLLKLLESKPSNAYDAFENISMEVKQAAVVSPATQPHHHHHHHHHHASSKEKEFEPEANVKLANTHVSMFKSEGNVDDDQDAGEAEMANLLEEAIPLEWAGVGLPREELFRFMLSTRSVLEQNPLKSARLFGKILGLQADYYVLETEFKEGEGDIPPPTPPEEKPAKAHDSDAEEDEEQSSHKQVNNTLLQAPSIPSEEFAGTNKYTYWVCNNVGEPWVRLPNITPAQIVAARSINKYVTGSLDSPVKSHPPFPGKERHYLRAQIGRIAAATTVSPRGYYTNEEEEDENNEEEVTLTPDPEYGGQPPSALLDMNSWVHHHEYILPQGRCSYYRMPSTRQNEEEEEDYEEEEENEEEEEIAESGPKLLTGIAEDAAFSNGGPAWCVRVCSQYNKRYALAYVRSLRWPGAHCVAWENKFANFYIGYPV